MFHFARVRERARLAGFLVFNDPTSANDLLDDLFATDSAEANIDFLGRRENVAAVVVAEDADLTASLMTQMDPVDDRAEIRPLLWIE